MAMPGSVANSRRPIPGTTWTSPCPHSSGSVPRWESSERHSVFVSFSGRRQPYRAFRRNFLFWGSALIPKESTHAGLLSYWGAARRRGWVPRHQHAHQLEISSFGSSTRYDKDLHLANQFGGGGRVGY